MKKALVEKEESKFKMITCPTPCCQADDVAIHPRLGSSAANIFCQTCGLELEVKASQAVLTKDGSWRSLMISSRSGTVEHVVKNGTASSKLTLQDMLHLVVMLLKDSEQNEALGEELQNAGVNLSADKLTI